MKFFLTIITFILPAMRFLNNYQLKGGINLIANKQYFTKRPAFYPTPAFGHLMAVGCRL